MRSPQTLSKPGIIFDIENIDSVQPLPLLSHYTFSLLLEGSLRGILNRGLEFFEQAKVRIRPLVICYHINDSQNV